MSTILERLGLTPQIVMRFVVRVDRTPGRDKSQVLNKFLMRERREAFHARGLTSKGTVRQRSENGKRKPRS